MRAPQGDGGAPAATLFAVLFPGYDDERKLAPVKGDHGVHVRTCDGKQVQASYDADVSPPQGTVTRVRDEPLDDGRRLAWIVTGGFRELDTKVWVFGVRVVYTVQKGILSIGVIAPFDRIEGPPLEWKRVPGSEPIYAEEEPNRSMGEMVRQSGTCFFRVTDRAIERVACLPLSCKHLHGMPADYEHVHGEWTIAFEGGAIVHRGKITSDRGSGRPTVASASYKVMTRYRVEGGLWTAEAPVYDPPDDATGHALPCTEPYQFIPGTGQ